ncbi:MAG: Fe-S cluster assembly protein SufB [Candidatus Micrarchaeia archaeon]
MEIDEGNYKEKFGWQDRIEYTFKTRKGIDEEIVKEISRVKNEPEWMLEKRLIALKIFNSKPNPKWGVDLSNIDYNSIIYYAKPTEKKSSKWEDLPEEIRDTFDKLGIPEAERSFFLGTEAQYDSEVVYSHVKEMLEKQGAVFISTDDAVKKYPDIVKKYFGSVVPPTDNKFAALNTAVWSGGSFVYVPKGVKLSVPLQAYFRINAEGIGQFERTLIVADEGSEVTYEEGCTAPIYSSTSLHAGVVEIVALKGAHVRYITVQNWSKNIYNMVTQRAHAYENAYVEWIGADIGSKANMIYPCVMLKGRNAKGKIISVSLAGKDQVKDTGGKVYHLAPNTSSQIVSKSVSSSNGATTYRGLLHIAEGAENAIATMRCDSLLVGNESKTSTYPYIKISDESASVTHEATTGKIGDDQLFYLMSRGMSEEDATAMIVLGFIDPLAKELPFEYSIELKRLVEIDLSHAVG